MKKPERENFTNTEIAVMPDSDVPVFSFNNSKYTDKIITESFNVSGNKFSAFYDADHKLIFVLDETLTENIPNVLLVIAERAGRKWDDILSNDYKIDLEDIRPKKNNKYQKLDIIYEGLPIYGQLIADYKTGVSIENALNDLAKFKIKAGQELAQMRLNAAEREITTATATIKKTEQTLAKLHTNKKALKTKIAKARSEVGKKPTKESAAKILKIQAQSEKVNDKEKRARARLRRAKKRLEFAQNDLQAALDALKAIEGTDNNLSEIEELNIQELKMADEPKPLFDKDPEIMDDKIAFQPVGFEPPVFNPTEFTTAESNKSIQIPEPIISTDAPEEPAIVPIIEEKPVIKEEPAPVSEPIAPITNNINITQSVIEPQQPIETPQQTQQTPPVSIERPASPVSNPNVTVLQPETNPKKPTIIYYVMFIILIGLSILTLSLYQSKMDDSAKPNLAKPTEPETVIVDEPTQPIAVDSAFITTEPVIENPQPVIIEEPVPEPEPVVAPVIEEPAPQLIQEEPAVAPIVEPEPIPVSIPESAPIIEPEPEIIEEPVIEEEPVPINQNLTLPLKPEYPVHGPVNQTIEKNSVSSQLCTSGTTPDENGCCEGESFRFIESMNVYACCSIADGECYPPLR